MEDLIKQKKAALTRIPIPMPSASCLPNNLEGTWSTVKRKSLTVAYVLIQIKRDKRRQRVKDQKTTRQCLPIILSQEETKI